MAVLDSRDHQSHQCDMESVYQPVRSSRSWRLWITCGKVMGTSSKE